MINEIDNNANSETDTPAAPQKTSAASQLNMKWFKSLYDIDRFKVNFAGEASRLAGVNIETKQETKKETE